jgi:RNA polymerase sigma factor (sigma-70 family)
MSHLLARLRSAFTPAKPPPDVELLSRFLDRHDQDAFAELVRRYGPMVLGVCRRTLGDGPDAEDAYQAAFLVLAKRAATVRGIGRVAGWLHGVATLCAKKARVRRAKRRQRERTGRVPDVPDTDSPVSADLTAVLDDELAAIPEKYRTAVVLCELRQLTLDQAAAELGVPRGTLASRLARGREALGKRLLRRGLFTIAPHVFYADMPSVEPTSSAQSLSHEVLRTMTVSNLRWMPLAVIPLVAVAAGLLAADPPKPKDPPPKEEEKVKRNATVERVKLIGLGGLLEQEAVRRDIGLTKDQQEKYDAAVEEMEKQLKAVAVASKAMQQMEGISLTDAQQLYDQLADVVLGLDAAIQEQLKADQVYRLKQLQLQREGPNALLGRLAVRELALTAEQEDKIAEAVKKLNKPKMVDIAQSASINPEEPRVAKLLAVVAAELDSIRDDALKQLSAEQKVKWKEMIREELPTICLLVASPQGYLFRQAYKSAK